MTLVKYKKFNELTNSYRNCVLWRDSCQFILRYFVNEKLVSHSRLICLNVAKLEHLKKHSQTNLLIWFGYQKFLPIGRWNHLALRCLTLTRSLYCKLLENTEHNWQIHVFILIAGLRAFPLKNAIPSKNTIWHHSNAWFQMITITHTKITWIRFIIATIFDMSNVSKLI